MEEKEHWHELEEVESGTEIPPEYLQRFERIALQDKAQLVERDEALKVMERAWKNWTQTGNALLIIGELGGGMTSLINCSCTLYPHARVVGQDARVSTSVALVNAIATELGFENCNSFTELKDALEAEEVEAAKTPEEVRASRVVVFENIERLFLRKLHGFNLLEEFLLFIHATKKYVYWIVSINRYSAYYLDQIIDFSANFSSILRLQAISGEAIEQMISDRNIGYQITFLKPERMTGAFAKRLKEADDETKQVILNAHFFKQLQGVASGNISTALKYWIKSVVYCREKKILLRPYQPKAIGDLTLESIFILEAILLHRSLSSSAIKAVLRDHSRNSMLKMENLIERDLIEPVLLSSAEPEYQINLIHIESLKTVMRSRLNRKIK